MPIMPGTWNEEVRTRIRVAVAAYAYEIEGDPIMSDATYDALAQRINVMQPTGNQKLDLFFMTSFDASTGMWVRNHPDIPGLKRIYEGLKK